eukprot:TRINITY_DN4406_c0_g1_i5.p1 TRINITY_DN4406_c0_g1~~TRINITY_DN4406_c0_g1_i5.p1  ORF type:complete len:213 (-),score=1.66 TRINITY_DN4406_c0_g1_i5:148-786(-)
MEILKNVNQMLQGVKNCKIFLKVGRKKKKKKKRSEEPPPYLPSHFLISFAVFFLKKKKKYYYCFFFFFFFKKRKYKKKGQYYTPNNLQFTLFNMSIAITNQHSLRIVTLYVTTLLQIKLEQSVKYTPEKDLFCTKFLTIWLKIDIYHFFHIFVRDFVMPKNARTSHLVNSTIIFSFSQKTNLQMQKLCNYQNFIIKCTPFCRKKIQAMVCTF